LKVSYKGDHNKIYLGACSTHGRGEKCIQDFDCKRLKGRVTWEALLYVEGSYLDVSYQMWYEEVGWIYPAHDTDQWRALVYMAMNLLFPKRRESS
jgi:hypothetical protein